MRRHLVEAELLGHRREDAAREQIAGLADRVLLALTAVYFPVATLPPYLEALSYTLPPTYAFEMGYSFM